MSTDEYYNMLLNLLLFLSAYIYIYALCRVVLLLLLLYFMDISFLGLLTLVRIA